jgi:hypothetical protein
MYTYIFGLALWGLVAIADSPGPSRDAAIELARATLAQEVSVEGDSFELIGATAAEWRDSSLGCPERGMVYTPVITPGYRVTLGARGSRYVVHVGQGRAVVCRGLSGSEKRVRPPAPGSAVSGDGKMEPAGALAGLKLAEKARDDLAKKLSVEKQQVTINFFRPTTWPDASLGCPTPGRVYPQEVTMGFLIELASGGKNYEYHSDMNRIVPCGT